MPTIPHDAALAASYALSRHVPDMERGFTICTSYGELPIAADEARRCPEIRHAVESILRYRLDVAERSQGGEA